MNDAASPRRKPNRYKHTLSEEELIRALTTAFSYGFDEGPHWTQVNLYEEKDYSQRNKA